MTRTTILGLTLLAGAWAMDLATVKSEPNLEKRAKLAMDYASGQVGAAGTAYSNGDMKAARAAVAAIRESVDLCQASLKATGKDARKSPKAFKRAEMDIRELLRRLKSLETDFSVDDRPLIVDTEQYLVEIHDDLIQQIMTKRKK